MKRMFAVGLAIVAALAFVPMANAGPVWAEVGDAGDLPGTAQTPTGSGPLTSITGNISSGTDADGYLIFIPNLALFSATTVGTPGTLGDTQLFLFSAAGVGIVGNDDDASDGVRSTLPLGSASGPAGNYLLVISGFDRDPVDSAGLEIFTDNFPGIQTPIAGRGPLADYNGASATGTYTISLQGAQFVPQGQAVPEPTSLALLGIGVAGLVGYGWRRRK